MSQSQRTQWMEALAAELAVNLEDLTDLPLDFDSMMNNGMDPFDAAQSILKV